MFHALLLSYYLCDAAADVAVLDRATVARCIGIYQDVKAEFLSEAELQALGADPLGFGGAHGRTAYLRFTAWEQENTALVERMKAEAQAHVMNAAAGF